MSGESIAAKAAKIATELTEETIQQIASRPGALPLRKEAARLSFIRTVCDALSQVEDWQIPSDLLNLWEGSTRDVVIVTRQLARYDFKQAFANLDQNVLQRANEQLNAAASYFARLRPYAILSASQATAEITALQSRVGSLEAEAQSRKIAAPLTSFYASERDYHQRRSVAFLAALVVAWLLVIAAVWLLFVWSPIGPSSTFVASATMGDLALTVSRGSLVLGLFYAIRFCSQGYREHQHLTTLNRSKVAALETYPALMADATDPEVKRAISGRLATAVLETEVTNRIHMPKEETGIDISSILKTVGR